MKPEEKARKNIDRLLEQAGWIVQEFNELNLSSGNGIVVRKFPVKTGALTTCSSLIERQWGQWNRKSR